MHFMLLLKGDPSPDTPPSPELVDAMRAYGRELAEAGVLLASEGLFPSAHGARVVTANGRKTVVDGPFAEAKELVAGFFLIDVKSREEAIEWASRCPVEYAVQGDQEAVVEVRQSAQTAEEAFPELGR
ncbi:YciI family protein [Microbispora corallina]|uniref:YCII-related domain-containing protein n=1 Tax=Microbispora corallina TaxID=83302 RepID=A0ABQ4FVK5_9ACTN|nr:YciI family protein [Microbispora corallina]GIH38854.1 hypothetical protein Mco01_18540 [Microbispora corallina]